MRTSDEYLDQAAKFHALAALTSEPSLKPRYADLAESYKRLAAERERLINQGIIPADE